MIYLKLERPLRRGHRWAGFLVIGLGIVFIGFGIALLAVVGAAALVLGAGVLLFKRLTGSGRPLERARNARSDLEVAADFEVLPGSAPSPAIEHERPAIPPRGV